MNGYCHTLVFGIIRKSTVLIKYTIILFFYETLIAFYEMLIACLASCLASCSMSVLLFVCCSTIRTLCLFLYTGRRAARQRCLQRQRPHAWLRSLAKPAGMGLRGGHAPSLYGRLCTIRHGGQHRSTCKAGKALGIGCRYAFANNSTFGTRH